MSKKIYVALAILLSTITPLTATEIRDIVGAAHISGYYPQNLPWPPSDSQKRDYLNEGAAELSAMGSRVIKVWLHPNAKAWYWYTANPTFPYVYNSAPEYRLRDIANSQQFRDLWAKPFTTYVMNVMANLPIYENGVENIGKFGSDPEGYRPVLDGMTPQEIAIEENAMYNLAAHFLQNYRYTGKTFVLQNHEGDWMLKKYSTGSDAIPDATRIQGMKDWINARQRGVTRARNDYGTYGVSVVHALEVNHIKEAQENLGITVTNHVMPSTNCDLYSLSWWDDVQTRTPATLTSRLQYLASKAPDSQLYGAFNLYLGEYGISENLEGPGLVLPGELPEQAVQRMIREVTETGLAWGLRYVLYWGLYCNGPQQQNVDRDSFVATNANMAGNWLIRPQETRFTPLYYYFQSLMGKSIHKYALRSSSGYYTSPDEGGGFAVRAGASVIREWEYITIVDQNGGPLIHGDLVNIMTWRGNFFKAYDGGGGYLDASADMPHTWETFGVLKRNGTGTIGVGDTVAFITSLVPRYVGVDQGGGLGDRFFYADRLEANLWETFTIASWGW